MIVLFTIFRTLYIYLNGEKMNLFICFLSGIATSLGYFFCYLKIEKNKLIASTLAFASSIMFFMSLLELIPEGIAIIKAHYMIPTSILMISLFFTIGILIALSSKTMKTIYIKSVFIPRLVLLFIIFWKVLSLI